MEQHSRSALKEKKRIVIKIGSSSLTHRETKDLNLMKIERLVRIISDLKGSGQGGCAGILRSDCCGKKSVASPRKTRQSR